ncbi:MAG: NAD(P)H-binding protein [bacterium]
MSETKIITIIGASGFIGHNLINYLLSETNYQVRAFARHTDTISVSPEYSDRLTLINGDAFDENAVKDAVRGCDAVIYLLHMMAEKGDYAQKEAEVAEICGRVIGEQGIRRVVFMGGLGSDKDQLSKHLKSRHNTGVILRKYVNSLIELRASMIVGEGSIAYEIMKRLVHRLPVQTLPTWATTQTQPITLDDALQYILASIKLPGNNHEIIEIGGPDKMSYRDLINSYGKFCGKKLILIKVPIVPLWLGAWWLNLFTPAKHAKVGRQMAESLMNPMVVTDDSAARIFPNIKPKHIDTAFK